MGSRLLVSLLLALTVLQAEAQDCTPDQSIKEIGFFPKQVEPAIVGEAYKQVLQIRVFPDTVIVVGGNPTLAIIDSIKVNNILGLPSGFYYTCSRNNCSFIPDSTGCAVLFGNPTAGQIGEYPLGIAIQVFAKVFNLPTSQRDTLDQFTVVVTDGSFTIQQFRGTYAVYPNPSNNGSFALSPQLSGKSNNIEIVDLNGRTVNFHREGNQLNITENQGVFIARFMLDDGNIVTKRLLVMN